MWKSSVQVCILLCILWSKLARRLPVVSAVNPEFVSDEYGNRADGQSNIVFANFSETVKYHAYGKTPLADQGSLLPFYSFVRTISSTTFGPGYPYEMVTAAFKGKVKAALSYLPVRFQVCLALGVLFLAFFMLVGFFVPFCLCFCGCCHRGDKEAPSVLCVLIWGLIVIAIICFFAGTGVGAAFQTNTAVSQTLPAVLDTLNYTPKDLVTFVNVSSNQILFIFVKINFTVKVIYRDLDNVGSIVSAIVLDSTGLNKASKGLEEIGDIADDSVVTVERLAQRVDGLANDVTSLQNLFTGAGSGSSSLNLNVSKMSKEIDSIPEQIQKAAEAYVNDLKDNIDSQLKRLDKIRNVIADLKDMAVNAIPVEKTEDILQSVKSKLNKFDSVRSSVTGGLLWLDVLAMLLMLLGVGMVMLFYSLRSRLIDLGEEPKTPFCNTVCGGRLIYAGIGIFMLLGWIWMLLSLLLFLLGAPLDAVFCTVVQDPEFNILDELIEERNILGDHPEGPWLATTLLNNSKVKITVGSVIRDCREDKTLFNATKLGHHPNINLNRLFNVDDVNLSTVNSFDPPKVTLLSSDFSSFLDNLTDAFDSIPFNELKTFDGDIEKAKEKIKTYYNQLPNSAQIAAMNTKLQMIKTGQSEVKSDTNLLKDHLKKLNPRTMEAKEVQAEISKVLKTATKEATKQFVKRMFKVVESRNDEIKKNIYEDYSKCRPLYDIFMGVLNRGLCDNVANVLNGAWMAMYWFHVFMLIAVEIAIHLHRLIPRPSLYRPARLQKQQSVTKQANERSLPPAPPPAQANERSLPPAPPHPLPVSTRPSRVGSLPVDSQAQNVGSGRGQSRRMGLHKDYFRRFISGWRVGKKGGKIRQDGRPDGLTLMSKGHADEESVDEVEGEQEEEDSVTVDEEQSQQEKSAHSTLNTSTRSLGKDSHH